MKKKKKNNKPLIILVVGLLLFGSLIGFSVYKLINHKNYVLEYKEEFEKNKVAEKEKCEEDIESLKKEIESIENEINTIDTELTSLQRQQTDEFMNSRGFSDKYYAFEDQMNAKRKEQAKKRTEIFEKNKTISDLKSTIWEIDNDFGDYRYENPKIKGINPYVTLVLGIFGCFVTFIVAAFSKLFKTLTSDKSYSEYTEIDESVLSSVDVNDGKLIKKEFYERLEKLLLASSKDNRDVIRKLCTKNMAKNYIDELDLLIKHKQKLVIKDVENIDSKIVEVRRGQHNIIIVVVQKIKLYECTKDTITNEVILGDNKKKQVKAYKLVFVKDYLRNHMMKKCPNCNANIKDITKMSCDYCGTVFDNNNYDWYLESKVIINED